jgi:glycosyltransferase involved in cell wall biosynthesis
MSIKIVVDGNIYSRQRVGGISNYFNELLPRIARHANTCIYVMVPPSPLARVPRAPGVVICRERQLPSLAGQSWRAESWFAPWRTRIQSAVWPLRLACMRDAIFHSTYYTMPPYSNTPQVLTVYDMIYERFSHIFNSLADDKFRNLKMNCIRRATRIMAISEQTKKDVCELSGRSGDTVDVVPLGIDRAVFYKTNDADVEHAFRAKHRLWDRYILSVGGRKDYKNGSALLRAFGESRLKEKVALVVAGEPWSQGELRLLRELGITERVHLVSLPSVEELRLCYNFADVFVQPSLYEGFGLTVLEAMACGTPVAASRGGSLPEVALDAACYFDPHSPDEMVAAIERLLDRATADEYRDRGYRRVRWFTWERTASETMAVYRKALAQSRARGTASCRRSE